MNVVLTLRDKVTIDPAVCFPEDTQQAVLKNRWQWSDPTQDVTPTITSFSCWSLIRTHYRANNARFMFVVDKPLSFSATTLLGQVLFELLRFLFWSVTRLPAKMERQMQMAAPTQRSIETPRTTLGYSRRNRSTLGTETSKCHLASLVETTPVVWNLNCLS